METKLKHVIAADMGYIPIGIENVSDGQLRDLKESFNIYSTLYLNKQYPTEIPGFADTADSLYNALLAVSERVYLALAIGLKLENKDFFKNNNNVGQKKNGTTLRFLHYPPLNDDISVSDTRLGEHTDYGSFTLLCQGSGAVPLEIKKADGQWIEAGYIPDTVLVNIADLMQQWTTDRLKSTPHRLQAVVDDKGRLPRYSIVFFVHPDDDTVVKCLDGSTKYPPVSAGEYLINRLAETYQY